jgi:hypothetical protein
MKNFFSDVKNTFTKPFTKKKTKNPDTPTGSPDIEYSGDSPDDLGFGFKLIEKIEDMPLGLSKTNSNDEFTSVDASDLIKDTHKVLTYDEWVQLINLAIKDRMILFEPVTRQRILKSIIKNGIPTDL